MKQNRGKVKINLESLTSVMPFILTSDGNMTITWASEAILKRIKEVVGTKVPDLLEFTDPSEKISKALLAGKTDTRCKLALLTKNSKIPLFGRWLHAGEGFVMLATPDVNTKEDLSRFSFDDFSEDTHLVDLLVTQEETEHSLQEAAFAAVVLKKRNLELEKSKQELDKKINETSKQRRAILNMLEDINESKRQLQTINVNLEKEINERKKMEEKLVEARQAALQASRTKSEFLASMSHEIRTPMNAIMGMADLLAETDLTPEQQRYVQIFKSASENLLNIINDILDISKVEAGQIELEKIDFNLNEIVEKTCEIMALRAHVKDIELFYLIEPDIPMNLIGDPVRLRQILVNLFGNAIKFTEKGEVVLHVDKDPQSKLPGFLLFTIADTGIGIPEKKMKTIFDSFSQADSSTTRKYGGTGLGLTISKRLVELMQGQIWVESTIGKGSKFYFTGQFGIQAKAKKRKSLPVVELKAMKILVVDDNATNRLILRHTLTNWGAVVTEAEGGRQALAELKRAKKSDNHYTLVLLDSRMPGMGGFEVADYIKRDPSLADITIMMLTSTQRKGDITKCQELKIASYLVKPIKKYDLLDAIKTAIGKTKIKPEKRKVARPIAMKDKRELDILLVEDSQDNRFLIQAYLKKTPYKIAIAENGKIAVEMFKSNNCDLILMDMQMPVMDGYTATRLIRSLEKEKELKTTPVIALTAYALKEEIQKSLDAGCTAHLTKPIKKAKLLESIIEYTKG